MATTPSRPVPNSNSKSSGPSTKSNAGSAKSTPIFVIIIAWLWAGIPLAWGVTQTVHKAMELFK